MPVIDEYPYTEPDEGPIVRDPDETPNALFMEPSVDPDAFLKKAKYIVQEYINKGPVNEDFPELISENQIYIVWFSKTLQNWKALVSTVNNDGLYYELTYNGNKKETYVDVYAKLHNVAISDDDL